MKIKIVFSFLCFFIENGLTDKKDLFASTYQMSELYKLEVEFLSLLQNYSKSNDFLSEQIQSYVNKVYENFDPAVLPEEYVAHPLNSLGIVKRLGFDFSEEIGPLIEENVNKSMPLSQLSKMSENFPNIYQYADACSSLAVLQEAFNLRTSDLISGKISSKAHFTGESLEFQSKIKLSWHQMFQIGTSTCNRGWFDTGIMWLNEAMKHAPKKFSSKKELERFRTMKVERSKAIQMHDKFLDKRGPKSEKARTFLVPFNEKLRKKKKFKNKATSLQEKVINIQPLFNYSIQLTQLSDNFYLICKDGKMETRTAAMDAQFKCRFQHHNNPYFKVGPLKLEEVSDHPFIVIFHDFLSEREMALLKSRASKNLERSEIGESLKKYKTDISRTSKQAWLPDRFFTSDLGPFVLTTDSGLPFNYPSMNFEKYLNKTEPWLYDLSEKIERVTKLNVLGPYASEIYQVANYGIGGQYNTHVDASDTQWKTVTSELPENEVIYGRIFGDRIATFMGYLEDIPLGGATAFPMIGTSVQPTKGSAVFWINLKTYGRLDRVTAHGGCPVLVGSKWIMNKWIGGFDQWHYLKCGLKKHDLIDLNQRWRASG